MRTKFSKAFLSELKNYGIKRIFGVPGRENASILFNEVPNLEFTTFRHEFNAGIAAAFNGILTGQPQVAFCTMGPGATNMCTALASAMLNFSPLILFSSQLESDDLFYNLTHQCVDQAKIFEPLTKWSYQIKHPDELHWVLEKAFSMALAEPVGPVHIAIPTDFFEQEISFLDYSIDAFITKEVPPSVSDELIKSAHQALTSASMPLCLIGAGAIRANSEAQLSEFLLQWNIPFVTAANAKGLLDNDHPLNLGAASCYMEGILGCNALEEIFAKVDVLFCIGYQYVDDLLPKMWKHGEPKKVIHIGSHPIFQIHSKYHPALEISGSIPAILKSISSYGVFSKSNRPLPSYKARIEEILSAPQQADCVLSPAEVWSVLNQFLDNCICVTDIGYYRHHAILFSKPKKPKTFFTDAGLSSFGTGLPSAIAAQFEFPEKTVLAVVGDGGFHASSCDLETLSRYKLPVIVIVLNNSCFELIHLYQKRSSQPSNSKIVMLGKVDFVRLAEANGCTGRYVQTCEELKEAITHFDRVGPLVLEVPLRYPENDKFKISF